MSTPSASGRQGAGARVLRLLPGGTPIDSGELSEGWKLESGTERPHVTLNMIASADGRASLSGRTAALGNWADRQIFHGLRADADAVMVGASTVRAERYGRMIRDPEVRARRVRQGRPEEPLAVVVSASLDLPPDLPLLAEPEARVVVLTGSAEEIPACAARVEYVRAGEGRAVDLAVALAELRTRFDVARLLCEGGPRLNGELLQADLVDELFLAVSPVLAGGSDELRIVGGRQLEPPVAMELTSVLAAESHLFLRYRMQRAGAD